MTRTVKTKFPFCLFLSYFDYSKHTFSFILANFALRILLSLSLPESQASFFPWLMKLDRFDKTQIKSVDIFPNFDAFLRLGFSFF